MKKWPRSIAALALATVLAAAVGCSSTDAFAPSTDSPAAQPTGLVTGIVDNLLATTELLTCSAQPYASSTKVIGPQGGTLAVGTHRLLIPAGALDRAVTIRAEQVRGRVNSVRFSPEGLRFSRPAVLTLSYANCSAIPLGKRVVYTSELLRILELLPTADDLRNKTVTAPIRHFSRYAVAW